MQSRTKVAKIEQRFSSNSYNMSYTSSKEKPESEEYTLSFAVGRCEETGSPVLITIQNRKSSTVPLDSVQSTVADSELGFLAEKLFL